MFNLIDPGYTIGKLVNYLNIIMLRKNYSGLTYLFLFFSWVTPSTTFLAKTYDPNSTIIRDSCKIDIYERNVQV